jgi:hypothetical protein
VLFVMPAFAATSIEVPNGQVIEKSKPLIGHWDAVLCADTPVGVRFTITLRPNADKSVSPIFTAIAAQGEDNTKPVEYRTVSFADVTNSDGTKFVGLAVTNGDALLRIRHSFPNARQTIVTDLDLIYTDNDGNEAIGFAIKEGDDPKNQWQYVKPLSTVCPQSDDNGGSRVRMIAASVRDETDQEIDAARKEFNQFAEDHKIEWAITGREAVGKPWFVRYYIFPENSNKPLTWEEEGYPRLLDAVVAVEKDFLTHPEGYSGKYDGGQRM